MGSPLEGEPFFFEQTSILEPIAMKLKVFIIIHCLFLATGLYADGPFKHGVASGDPTSESVILWTRVSPPEGDKVNVRWEVSRDRGFAELAASGDFTTDAVRDYTVKVDAGGLSSGTTYYYRFSALDDTSEVGRTRTLPSGRIDQVSLAVVSCSHYEYGYFNTYAALSEDRRLDAVLHLGDYLYEYQARKRVGEDWTRVHEPAHELVTLEDYRIRYAQYRTDPDLQAAHRNHPFITVWDDHESANNSHLSGAENHDPDQGAWADRMEASRQAYLEWLPVRERADREIFRDFAYGNLVHLVMLDTRLAGRDEQIYDFQDTAVSAADRRLLGDEQMAWLDERLGSTNARWTVFGNQVVFSPRIFGSDVVRHRSGDSWDGYPAERRRVWDLISKHRIENWVVATGDTHQTFVFDLVAPDDVQAYDPETGAGRSGMEFAVPSISAANPGDRLEAGEVTVRELDMKTSGLTPHLKWVDMRNHGYLRLEISVDKAEAVYVYVEKLRKRDSSHFEALRFTLPARHSAAHLYLEPE